VKNRRTIDKRLDGIIVTGNEKRYCSILMPEEGDSLVQYVKNKDRAYKGINKANLTKWITRKEGSNCFSEVNKR